MRPNLYETITSGNINDLNHLQTATVDNDDDDLLLQMTPLKNTTLHVAAQFGRQAAFVEGICRKCPSLLLQQNLEGDTPLHIAARLGSWDIVQIFLTQYPKIHREYVESSGGGGGGVEAGGSLTIVQQLVRMTNNAKDTALHEAVRNHDFEVVKLLTQADPIFEYSANNAGETPLYMCVEDGLYDCANQILSKCPSSAHGGPRGRTALHAAAFDLHNSDIKELLLKKKSIEIIKEADADGCTALHYAAFLGNVEMVGRLLKADPSVAYMSDNDGKTALHFAATSNSCSNRITQVIKVVIQQAADCWQMLDKNGQNFLHVAAENGKLDVINYIVKESKVVVKNLINKKDNDGNTPLHLVIKSGNIRCLRALITRDVHHSVNKWAFNKDNFTPYEIVLNMLATTFEAELPKKKFLYKALPDLRPSNTITNRRGKLIKEAQETDEFSIVQRAMYGPRRRKEIIRKMEKLSHIHLLMATLVATVTFAAGFTLPGGYNSSDAGPHKGMATLLRSPAFIAFVVTNTLAMLLSSFAIFIQFWYNFISEVEEKNTVRVVRITLGCTFGAVVAMVVAFATGTYAPLSEAPGLAVPLCLLICSFFVFCALLILKLNRWSHPKYTILEKYARKQ